MKKNTTTLIWIVLTVFAIFQACKEKPSAPLYDNPLDVENTAPTSSFTVNPTAGTTTTPFAFNASASSDAEDAPAALEVRWDWENDGSWDTGYSTTKTANHQYATEGTKTVRMEVRDSGDLTNSTTRQLTVSTSNTAPTASFTVNPAAGTTLTTFNVDASASSDVEDASAVLEVRWDWENDGTWDTGYTTTKTADHQYATDGLKTIQMEVRDSGGLSNTTTRQVGVTVGNTAPTASFTVNPGSGTTGTNFGFDASASSDNEDAASALQVRWDWENDGSWDSNYSTVKTANHQYAGEGTYTVNMEVMDVSGLTNSTTSQVVVSGFETGTVTDVDGNVYQTVKIGTQWWMAENLKVTRYRTGAAIPNITVNGDWVGLTTGAYGAYNNDNGNVSTYGLLYNWYAVNDGRNLAPAGWHIPTDDEWKQLEIYLGMSPGAADATGSRGTDQGGKLKETGTVHWNTDVGATNSTGFNALPGGNRSYTNGGYDLLGNNGFWWSSSQFDADWASYRFLSGGGTQIGRQNGPKQFGYSVRCVMD